jgi:hypothetical protein
LVGISWHLSPSHRLFNKSPLSHSLSFIPPIAVDTRRDWEQRWLLALRIYLQLWQMLIHAKEREQQIGNCGCGNNLNTMKYEYWSILYPFSVRGACWCCG